jgi:arylsulfatase
LRAALLREAPLVAEGLQQAGYRTAAELTNPFLSQRYGWERGIDWFRNEDGSNTDLLLTSQTARGGTVTEHARAWLALNRQKPFFLWLHYLDPHAPYDSPGSPENLRKQYPPNWETRRSYWYGEMAGAPAEERSRYQEFCRRMYAEEVRYADRWVGALLAELKRKRLYHGSLIVIFADHGEELFDHGAFEHGHTLHEELLHVPLLVKWPKGTEADASITETVSLASVAPTLLEVAASPKQAGAAARPLPRQDGGPGEAVYSEAPLYGADQTALTTDHYKVIYHLPADGDDGSFEVYDRRRDPGEKINLAVGPAAEELKDRLRRMTERALKARREASRDVPRAALDEGAKRRLRSLGYLSE